MESRKSKGGHATLLKDQRESAASPGTLEERLFPAHSKPWKRGCADIKYVQALEFRRQRGI